MWTATKSSKIDFDPGISPGGYTLGCDWRHWTAAMKSFFSSVLRFRLVPFSLRLNKHPERIELTILCELTGCRGYISSLETS